jgi:regulator of cell morphogenesis and NO signaling
MKTTLNVDGANCSACFNETLEALGRIDGVRAVRGSIAGPCIEIDHDDVALDILTATVRDHLHGIKMFSNEMCMVPLDPVAAPTPCIHQRVAPHSDTRRPPSARKPVRPSMTLGEIVTLRPSLAADLERRGLDYCCHGARTFEAAAHEVGLDPETVADELSALHVDEQAADWTSLGMSELVDHIEAVHHRPLRAQLPRIATLVDKIVTVHRDRHGELVDVQRLFGELRAELEPHLVREELALFPMIRKLASGTDATASDIDYLAAQIDFLSAEHESVGACLEELRRVTNGYATPADGCASYVACYGTLADLEADTHLHVHKENNVLFPSARATAAANRATRSRGPQ